MQHLVIEVLPHDNRHTLQLGMRRYRYQYRVLVAIPILVSGVTLMFVLQRYLRQSPRSRETCWGMRSVENYKKISKYSVFVLLSTEKQLLVLCSFCENVVSAHPWLRWYTALQLLQPTTLQALKRISHSAYTVCPHAYIYTHTWRYANACPHDDTTSWWNIRSNRMPLRFRENNKWKEWSKEMISETRTAYCYYKIRNLF